MRLKDYYPVMIGFLLVFFLIVHMVFMPSSISANHSPTTSTIGGVEIKEKSRSEIEAFLASQIIEWKEQELIIQGSTARIQIPSEYVSFDIKKTVDDYLSMTSKPWYQVWGKAPVIHIPIEVSLSEETHELLKEAPFFYKEPTLEIIKEHAGFLRPMPVIPEETTLSKEKMDRVSFEIADVVVDGKGLNSIIEVINDVSILPGERFSLLENLEGQQHMYSEETVNFFASIMYSAVLGADTSILERHSQHKIPAYLQPGIEVSVDRKVNKDFIFINEGDAPIIIAASVADARLKLELYSINYDYEITYNVSNRVKVEPRTIYRLTSDLSAGKERIIEEGRAGLRVEVYKKTSEIGGSFEDEKLVSTDFYPPKHKVIEVSSMPAPVIETNPEDSGAPDESSHSLEENGHVAGTEDGAGEVASEDIVYDKGGNIIGAKEEGHQQ